MLLPVLLDRSRPESLTMQLSSQLRDGIERGMIPSGIRMPSTRNLSEQLGISRNTAVRAYDILVMEGFATATPASGIFATRPAVVAPLPTAAAADRSILLAAAGQPSRSLRPASEQHRLSFDFVPGRPSPRLFPLRTWRRLVVGALSQAGPADLSRHGDPAGLSDLRTALSGFLSATRGMAADPSRIIITHGAQEAYSLAARVLLGPGRTALLEDPCYLGAARAFEASGATLRGVPVDAEGLRPDALPDRGDLLYLTPAHQYPTGAVLPMHRRRAVLDWARRTGCTIIEDDYDGDLRYEGSPLPSLAGAAPDHTIHIGSFTPTLGAGLRLGFMVVPPSLVEPLTAAKAAQTHGNPWLEQAVLAGFLRGGGYARHVARLRTAYREVRDATLSALVQQFGEVSAQGTSCGLHMLWMLPPGVPEAGTLEMLARRARIGLYPFRSAAVWQQAPTPLGTRGIVLGFGPLTPWQVVDGIARLSDAVDDRLDRHHDLLHDLLANEPRTALPQPAPSVRHRLALRPGAARRPRLRTETAAQDSSRMAEVTGIYRYPVKGLSAQPLRGIRLEAGQPFPFDRIFALSRSNAKVDPDNPHWAKKGLFVMLMLEEALATVRTHVDIDTMRLTVTSQAGAPLLSADLESHQGRLAVEAFVEQLVPTLRGRPRLVRSRGGAHFMDKPDNVLSVMNLATVRSLEERWGYRLDPLRFRANIYIDGAGPWEEFDWIGGTLRINDTVLRVDRRNGRCGATNVNPETGQRDLELPAALRAAFGHKDLGVYVVIEAPGTVLVGDAVTTPDQVPGPTNTQAAHVADGTSRRFICQGCYYIYDEAMGVPAAGIPPGTSMAALPHDYRCPDCGTDAGKLRPYAQ